jgi:hypothetical protein
MFNNQINISKQHQRPHLTAIACYRHLSQYQSFMNLENINKVESLIKERNEIIEFKTKTAENIGDGFININEVQFEADFLRPIYSQEFVKELNRLVSEKCDEYVIMIDNQLKKL